MIFVAVKQIAAWVCSLGCADGCENGIAEDHMRLWDPGSDDQLYASGKRGSDESVLA